MKEGSFKRLHELAFAYCEDSLNEEEARELEQLISSDREAAIEFHNCMKVNIRLGRMLRGLGEQTSFSSMDPEQMLALNDDSDASVSQPGPRKGNRGLGFTLFAVAASLLAFFFYQSSSTDEESAFAARIVNKVDCDWESERWGTALSPELQIGQILNLDNGLMVLEFGKGAQVTLEGPVQFKIESAERGFLYSGKLTARVPERAQGFTVGTPSCESIDLGTEFGLMVRDDGTSETHVFEGEVVLKKTKPEENTPVEELHLTTAMATSVDGETFEMSHFEAKPESFTRFDFLSTDTVVDRAIARSIPAEGKLMLWFDAARQIQLDARNRVSSWGDLMFADNIDIENAWQVAVQKRPYFVEDGINGKPAVRFKNKTHLVTAPVATGDDLTVFLVFKCLTQKIGPLKAAMLMNFNGPPNVVISRNGQNELVGRMFSGWRDGAFLQGTWLTAPVLEEKVPIVSTFVYSHSENRSALFANGQLCIEGEATESAAITSPKYIGKHREPNKAYFHGDIAEILVFNTAFSDPECEHLSETLMQKYSIETSVAEVEIGE